MPLLVSISLHWLYNFSMKGFLETTFTTANRIDQQWKIFIKFIVSILILLILISILIQPG